MLSALEGLDIVTPVIAAVCRAGGGGDPAGVVRGAAARHGENRYAFGPVMLLWFAVIALLGIWGVAQHPGVLLAINPRYGVSFLFSNGATGFLVLGGVFLCVTGAEALYADMGHFGARPIRLAWSAVVLPAWC